MPKKMLIDATHAEETRVVVVDGNKVDDFDFESINKRQLAGNIYLAKVTRVEPSLQAAFVDYGGNRHGFLAFAEVHPDYYQIPVADREALLAEEAEEEERAAAREERRNGDRPAARDKAEKTEKEGRKGRSRGRRGRKEARAAETAEGGSGVRGLEVIEPEGDDEEDTVSAEISGLEIAEIDADEEDDADRASDDAEMDPEDAEDADDTVRSMSEDTGLGDDSVSEEIGGDIDTAERPHKPEDAEAEEAAKDTPADVTEDEDKHAEAEAAQPEQAAAEDTGRSKPRKRRRRRKSKDDEAEAAPAQEAAESDRAPEEDDENGEKPQVDEVGAEDLQEEVAEIRRTRRRRYKIQDVIKVRQIMLVQVVKEERGNKGAALTTYLSLAGRYCVLMPNTARGGGISRKITNATDRKRLRDIVAELDVPKGMGLIVRTAGAERTRAEIKRDYEFLLRQWEQVRDLTLKSIAPTLIYEEGSLIKRAIRDLYSKEIDTILVEGDAGYREAKDYMKMLMPSHAKNVQQYTDQIPLYMRYQVESYLNGMFNPTVQLKSGGYIVIGVTEALVAIDVNSGRSTKEGSIEETALKTNLEAADEVARQLRLRDLAGLIVIDFIDMEENRNNRAVEKRMKDRLKSDRARIQVGRISPFGLMEMSRQRLRPGMLEATTQPCPHCHGQGIIRSSESLALSILREVEEEGVRGRSAEVDVAVPIDIANYLMNHKRAHLTQIEERYGLVIMLKGDPLLTAPDYSIERSRTASRPAITAADVVITAESAATAEVAPAAAVEPEVAEEPEARQRPEDESGDDSRSRRRRGKRGGRRRRGGRPEGERGEETAADAPGAEDTEDEGEGEGRSRRRRRRRGRRDEDAAKTEAEPVETAAEEPTELAAEAPEAAPEPVEAEPAEAAAETIAAPLAALAEVEPAPEATPEAAGSDAEPQAAAPEVETPAIAPEPEAEIAAAPEPEVEDQPEPAPETKSVTRAGAPEQEQPAEPEATAADEPAETVDSAAAATPPADETSAEEAPAEPARPKRRGWWMLR